MLTAGWEHFLLVEHKCPVTIAFMMAHKCFRLEDLIAALIETEGGVQQAADHVGVTRMTIRRWRHGHSFPPKPARRRLAPLLGCTAEDLDRMRSAYEGDAA